MFHGELEVVDYKNKIFIIKKNNIYIYNLNFFKLIMLTKKWINHSSSLTGLGNLYFS